MSGRVYIGRWVGRRSALRAITFATILIPSALFLFYASLSLDAALTTAKERIARRSVALAEQLARTFDVQAAVLDLFASRIGGMTPEEVATAPALYHAFQERVGQDKLSRSIIVTDWRGKVLASDRPLPGMRIDDRAYFTEALQRNGLVIGQPVVSRMNGQRVIPVARRWAGGVMAVTLQVSTVEQILASRADGLGEAPVITLTRGDQQLLVQWSGEKATLPAPPVRTGAVQDGVFHLDGASWRQSRLVGYQQLGQYPLRIVFSVRTAAIVTDWALGLVPHGLLAMTATVLLVIAGRMVLRREREAADAVAAGIAEAARASRAVSRFFDAAGHDLCQPLQAVRLFLEVLDGRLAGETERKVLRQALGALEGADALLTSLRSVSLLDAGLVRPCLQDVAVDDILADLVVEIGEVAASRGIVLRRVRCSAQVHTDPELLRRMVRSLLLNAVAFTRSGSVLVGARLYGDLIRIEVWDTGIGIAPEYLDTVFDDFVQLGNPERNRQKGLGLGLALVRRLSELLGVRKGVLSWPGRGSVFWVALPRAAR